MISSCCLIDLIIKGHLCFCFVKFPEFCDTILNICVKKKWQFDNQKFLFFITVVTMLTVIKTGSLKCCNMNNSTSIRSFEIYLSINIQIIISKSSANYYYSFCFLIRPLVNNVSCLLFCQPGNKFDSQQVRVTSCINFPIQ